MVQAKIKFIVIGGVAAIDRKANTDKRTESCRRSEIKSHKKIADNSMDVPPNPHPSGCELMHAFCRMRRLTIMIFFAPCIRLAGFIESRLRSPQLFHG